MNRTGTPADETLTGDTGNDILNGGGGADTLEGLDGDDRLDSGQVYDPVAKVWRKDDKGDRLDGGRGNDTLQGGAGADILLGGEGDDKLTGGGGKDLLQGGDGKDELRSGLVYDPLTRTSARDDAGDRLEGGDGDDLLVGGASHDVLLGGPGNDHLGGGGGHDLLMGGDGDDRLESSEVYDPVSNRWTWDAEGDSFYGGNGNDLLYGADGDDVLDGEAGNDRLDGGDGKDRLLGGAGADILDGGEGNDTLLGGDGDDELVDYQGNNQLFGGAGNDRLYGGGGNDTLDGGTGRNFLQGGLGDDVYIIRSELDVISDWGGQDSGVIHADWYRPVGAVEQWTWAEGVQRLPNWIAALATGAIESRVDGSIKTVQYHFAERPASFFSDRDSAHFQPFNEAQRVFTRQVFDYISTVVNVQFREASDPENPSVLVMGNNWQSDSAGYASSRILMLSTGTADNLAPTTRNSAVNTLLHEIGHALGLKHPFGPPGPNLSSFEDAGRYTVMSYNAEWNNLSLAYSPLDLAALQYMYGPARAQAAGDTTWVLDPRKANFIADGDGRNDVLDASAYTGNVTLDLRPGYWGFLGAKADSIVKPGQVTVNFGSVIEHLRGGAGNDSLTGNAADNYIEGGAGDDLLTGGAGNDGLEGGAGRDTAVYSGKRANYDIDVWRDGVTVNSDATGDSDYLDGIELLRFDDVMVALDPAGVAGQAYRLYQAAFNRTPDLPGLGYWISRMEAGTGLLDVASAFIGSAEFIGMYGSNPSHASFLQKVYQNILHRAPDPGGFDFWLRAMDNRQASAAEVLAQFSESTENVAALAGVLEDGIAYIPPIG